MARESYLKLGVEIAAHSITLGYTVFSGTQVMQFIAVYIKGQSILHCLSYALQLC